MTLNEPLEQDFFIITFNVGKFIQSTQLAAHCLGESICTLRYGRWYLACDAVRTELGVECGTVVKEFAVAKMGKEGEPAVICKRQLLGP